MSDSELVKFNIKLSAQWWKNPPKVRVSLDDDVIGEFEVTEQNDKNEIKEFAFERELTEGEHKIKITLYDKKFIETVLDPDDESVILRDQLLFVKDIELDEISLDFLTYSKSKFYPDKTLRPDLPDLIAPENTLGFNGDYVFEFNCPTYIWFLENL